MMFCGEVCLAVDASAEKVEARIMQYAAGAIPGFVDMVGPL
jgi:hypothetical protein